MQFELGPVSTSRISSSTLCERPDLMDSRDIAERTGKQHAHVCRDILAMLQDLGIPESKFGSGYTDAQNQRRKCFLLPKRESLILASGYSIPLRAKIIDRWVELESKTPVPTNMIEALTLALQQAKTIEAYKARVEMDAPKVAVHDRIANAEGLFGIYEAAKQVGVAPKAFVKFLRSEDILFPRNKKLLPKQPWIEKGYFRVVTKTVVVRNDLDQEVDKAVDETKFTAKGIAWIAGKVASLTAGKSIMKS